MVACNLGSRNTTIDLLADSLPILGTLDRPVVNETGLSGNFDFIIDFAVDPSGAHLNVPVDAPGPTVLQVLRDQLGLKLESTDGPIRAIVIDHIERPSDN